MADKTVSITLNGIDSSDKKTSSKIAYVNPNLDNATLAQFGSMCADLSTDTNTSIVKTTDEDITGATTKTPIEFREGQAPPATLSWSTITSEMSSSGEYSDMYYISSYDSSTRPPEFRPTVHLNCNVNVNGVGVNATIHFETVTFFLYSDKTYEPSDDFDVKLFIPETETTASATVTIHITRN